MDARGTSEEKRHFRAFSVTSGVLCAGLALASLSIVKALKNRASVTPRAEDVRASQRVVPAAAGADEHAELMPAAVAGGDGVVEPANRETKVSAAVPGLVSAVLVQEGDVVQAGQALMQLDSAPEAAALATAEAELASAQAELAKVTRGQRREDVDAANADAKAAEARAALSADVLTRTRVLAEGGAATPQEMARADRQAEVDRRTAESLVARQRAAVSGSRYEDLLIARAHLKSAESSRDQRRAMLERLSIRAPITGQVLQLKYRAGEYETPGAGQEPVALMGDTRELRVRLDVDERDIGKVTLGAPAFVTASAYPSRKFHGSVVEIARRMGRKNVRTDDPTERVDTKILEVVIALVEREGLVPGLRVRGYIQPASPGPGATRARDPKTLWRLCRVIRNALSVVLDS